MLHNTHCKVTNNKALGTLRILLQVAFRGDVHILKSHAPQFISAQWRQEQISNGRFSIKHFSVSATADQRLRRHCDTL